ncbi:hypothetical protein LTR85_005090 [Meristemomyces frigidus]|nr:hypothetical protein LTR85_005090 [Meristemomyces frigidus]
MHDVEPKASKATSTSTETSPKKQYLLTIAPELRNRIYHEALKSPDRIRLSTKEQPLQPALLRTCRQIRQEAIGIYYNINRLEITVYDFRGAITKPIWDTFILHYKERAAALSAWMLTVECGDGLDTTMVNNYRAWLKLCHQHPHLAPSEWRHYWVNCVYSAVRRAFLFVTGCHTRRWEELHEVLDEHLRVARGGLEEWGAVGSLELVKLLPEFPELEDVMAEQGYRDVGL